MYSTWYLPPSKDSELPMRMRTFLSFKAKGGKGGRFWQIGLKPRCGGVTWTGHWFLMLCISFLTSPSTIFPWGGAVSVESETSLPGPEFQPLCWLTQALYFSAQSSHSPRAVAQSLGRNPEAPRLSIEVSGCSFYLQHTTHFPFKSCESHRKLSLCVLVLALSNFLPVLLRIPGWPPPWSHSASMSWVLDHNCVPWDPCCCSSVFWLTAEGACVPEGSLFTHWRSIFIMY